MFFSDEVNKLKNKYFITNKIFLEINLNYFDKLISDFLDDGIISEEEENHIENYIEFYKSQNLDTSFLDNNNSIKQICLKYLKKL